MNKETIDTKKTTWVSPQDTKVEIHHSFGVMSDTDVYDEFGFARLLTVHPSEQSYLDDEPLTVYAASTSSLIKVYRFKELVTGLSALSVNSNFQTTPELLRAFTGINREHAIGVFPDHLNFLEHQNSKDIRKQRRFAECVTRVCIGDIWALHHDSTTDIGRFLDVCHILETKEVDEVVSLSIGNLPNVVTCFSVDDEDNVCASISMIVLAGKKFKLMGVNPQTRTITVKIIAV